MVLAQQADQTVERNAPASPRRSDLALPEDPGLPPGWLDIEQVRDPYQLAIGLAGSADALRDFFKDPRWAAQLADAYFARGVEDQIAFLGAHLARLTVIVRAIADQIAQDRESFPAIRAEIEKEIRARAAS